jgi:hypothetical protein
LPVVVEEVQHGNQCGARSPEHAPGNIDHAVQFGPRHFERGGIFVGGFDEERPSLLPRLRAWAPARGVPKELHKIQAL